MKEKQKQSDVEYFSVDDSNLGEIGDITLSLVPKPNRKK
jgi:hypothetical protein